MSADKSNFASVFLSRGLISLLSFVLAVALLNVNIFSLDLSAESAILIDGNSGRIIYGENYDRKMAMASTTKIMTAVVVIENTSLSDKVKIPRAAVGIEGSSIYLCEGEVLTVEELLYSLLLSSANDAATALALYVGGDIEVFADMMNEKARALGLCDTSFENPHGLDGDNHYTTAEDLAKLAAYALKIDVFKKIVSTYKAYIPFCGKKNGRLVVNHNRLLRSYEGAIGVKTGFTKKSGRCLVSAAERDGALFIAVTLNAPNDWSDHKTMLDYGFENYENVTPDKVSLRLPVISGVKTHVVCGTVNRLSVLLSKEHADIEVRLELYQFAYAPIKKGERLGRAVYMCGDEMIGELDIVALETVEQATQKYTIWDKFLDKIMNE